MDKIDVDVAIVGGGIAGLWIANLLLRRGIDVALCEGDAVGGGQTGAAQGIIHSGAKYALDGAATSTAQAIAPMAARWRRCLSGRGEIDLRGLPLLAPHCHLWVPNAPHERPTTAFSAASRAGAELVAPRDYPAPFKPGAGTLLRLTDFVVDVPALCQRLAQPLGERLVKMRVQAGDVAVAGGNVEALRNDASAVRARRFVFAAGTGNAALAAAAGCPVPMQRRPLQQVIARGPGPVPIFVHCLADGMAQPALTITTHANRHIIGGGLAEAGATRSKRAQVAAARRALCAALPALDWRERRFDTLRIDRAEPAQAQGARPHQAFVVARGNCLTVWPVKLTFAPLLGDMALRALAA